MPGLFEQFPHTNFHELNLDWMIDLLNQFKQDLEDRAVISVNGMTGEVTLYESENVILPPLTNASSWRLVRMMDGQYVGVLFQDGHVWLQQGNSTLKLLTTEDIPTSAGVVSINGMGGIVRLTGANIPIDNSADPDSIRLALETERNTRITADTNLQTQINSLNEQIETSYYDIPNIGVIRFIGKEAVIDFTNKSGEIPSTGLQLPYTFVDDVQTICQYYDGSNNTLGELRIYKNGTIFVRAPGSYVNATYVLGQAVVYLA